MTKACVKVKARHNVQSGELGMTPWGAMADGSFVWIFDIGSLGFV